MTLKVTLMVVYDDATVVDSIELRDRLAREIEHAVAAGLLTSDGTEIVDTYNYRVERVD